MCDSKFARHHDAAATDQPRTQDAAMRRSIRAGRDQRGAVTGEAGDAVEAHGLEGFRQGHRRQDGGQAAPQH
jgi:hypothetical protein